MHSLRRLHEYLPRLPPQRGPELWGDLFRTDRDHHRSRFRYAQVQQSAVRLDAQWQLHQCLPGQDQHPRADLQMATSHGRAQSAAAGQEGGDPRHWQGHERAAPLSRGDLGGWTCIRAPAAICDLQLAQSMGTAARSAGASQTELPQLVYREQDAPMSSRDAILAAVRANKPAASPISAISLFTRESRPLLGQFQETLESMGGKLALAGAGDLDDWVRSLFPNASVICSATPEVRGTRPLDN